MSQTIDKLRILRMFLLAAYQEWRKEVWPRDIDGRYCCDGRECGCQGSSVREVYMWRLK